MTNDGFSADDPEEVTVGVDSDIVAEIRAEVTSRTAADDLKIWTDTESEQSPSEPDGSVSLIGQSAPPPVRVEYWQPGTTVEEPRDQVVKNPQTRRRVPLWLIVLVAAILIVAISVLVAVALAGGSS